MRPKIFHATEHDIDSSMLDADALFVLNKFHEAGYSAYLVGGSVRDLLVKRVPKDFDISTSAKPEEIKKLFRRQCILIGKRFRLAHIRFGRKIIEVSTFRTGDNDSDLIIRDNQWGTPEEDALRRDFTINGLFYDPTNHSVIDYAGGWEDIHKGILRTIGNPEIRFKQDPVRMIRLVKFRARFGFEIEMETKNALKQCIDEIVKSSPARILEEIFRMLESGASSSFFHLMKDSGLLKILFPVLTEFLESAHGQTIYDLLSAADQINMNSRYPLERPVLVSCLLFPLLESEIQKEYLSKNHTPHLGEIIMLTGSLIKGIMTSSVSHFPRRMSSSMSYILSTQYRLTPLSGKQQHPTKFMRNKEFGLAIKFLKVRALCNKDVVDAYGGWNRQYRHYNRRGEHKKPPHPPPQRKRRYVKPKKT